VRQLMQVAVENYFAVAQQQKAPAVLAFPCYSAKI
jgi:hypothetical protein